ncbi:acid resistance repetitive basic protein Asr [Yersinia mollaretii]|uniref:Acid shock protein n=1 Tax=Yersinia mollaretii (strain ATCC 43969 / DSM 18520 / CIP 103324 / CNY 7263 / WAIP 204) TaxID=349967 RepID=A0ABM9YC35_YERMW|nr:acid resistance repetitive basic protein Asr [Yersinia mollaretii]EEQ11449.1 acid shock protein precursor [Yersinia mollaretii ATCC 43969]MDN0109881.1 acid resistance repetitive basic protein Asr [Yersinia mollaretii]QKJ04345.1 acid resistance repetitive basic protein Asr [Yersinia mollaretii ATCC 43969]
MKTVLALIVAATLGISSVAFAADTVAPPVAPMATTPAAHSAPAKTVHHKKATKSMKKMDKAAPMQKAQAAKKHPKKAAHSKSAPAVVPVAK